MLLSQLLLMLFSNFYSSLNIVVFVLLLQFFLTVPSTLFCANVKNNLAWNVHIPFYFPLILQHIVDLLQIVCYGKLKQYSTFIDNLYFGRICINMCPKWNINYYIFTQKNQKGQWQPSKIFHMSKGALKSYVLEPTKINKEEI